MTDLDETNVCYLCEITHDCAEGNEVEAINGEWVCLSCQDKLISELAPKIKADAVEGYHSELLDATKVLFHPHLNGVKAVYLMKLEGGE